MTQKIKFNFLQKTLPRVNPLGVSVALLGSVVALVSVSQTALAASREWDAGDGFATSTRGKKTQILPGSILNVVKLFDASSACFYFDKTNRFMRMFSGLKCKVDSEGGVIGVSKVELTSTLELLKPSLDSQIRLQLCATFRLREKQTPPPKFARCMAMAKAI